MSGEFVLFNDNLVASTAVSFFEFNTTIFRFIFHVLVHNHIMIGYTISRIIERDRCLRKVVHVDLFSLTAHFGFENLTL